MMDVVGSRKARDSVVISGSVWESRMKMDEVKGGIKVFNGEDKASTNNKIVSKRSPTTSNGTKRKPWNSDGFDGSEKSSCQIKQCKELKSPIQARKLRSDGNEENSVVVVGKIERSPIQIKKSKSEVMSKSSELVERNEKVPIQLRKVKSDSVKMSSIENNDKAIVAFVGSDNREAESGEVEKGIDESAKEIEKTQVGIVESAKEIEKTEVGIDESGETCKEFGVCHIPNQPIKDEVEEEEKEEVEIEKSFDIKEISLPTPKKVMNEVKKFHQSYEKRVPNFSATVEKSPSINKHSTIHQNIPRQNPTSNEHHSFQEKNTKLQSFVDLVMWKDVPRSAFVFGIGSFVIISSSYAKEINISFISVMSYLGLFYLAATFLYRSIICRGVIEMDNMMRHHVVGEEEAIWVLQFILPYLNEFLLKLRALFCGDPATTMKLAVLLFALARCGSSITIWKVAKWGFFGVFTVPKVCSSYSSQLTAYAKFWARRFHDAWESCSHKKGVALAIFVLVWNLSSVVARIWAAFMLFVAFRYYQQSLLREDEWEEDEVEGDGDTCQSTIGKERYGGGPLFVDISKSNNTKRKKKY